MVNKPNYDDEISGKKQQARVVFQFYIHPSVVMEMLMVRKITILGNNINDNYILRRLISCKFQPC
jgi:hypothetical protein